MPEAPLTFAQIAGQESAVAVLRRTLADGGDSGSFLFTGPQGCGKTTTAWALAAAVSCLAPRIDPYDACTECDACKRLSRGVNPEVSLVQPAGDQTQIWQFWDREGKPRGILQHALPYSPSIGRKRVFIVERADTLTEGAANSLLKVLEEPPHYVVFILLAPHAGRVLPTILSRCRMVRFGAMPLAGLAEWLADRHAVAADRAATLAALAQGCVGTAQSLASSKTAYGEIGVCTDAGMALLSASGLGVLRCAEALRQAAKGLKFLGDEPPAPAAAAPAPDADNTKERAGRRQMGAALDLVAVVARDALALSLVGPGASIVNEERRSAILAVADRRQPREWITAIDQIAVARRRVDMNANPAILTDALAVTLAASAQR
ncbi:MAG: AAA family ATPase [Armatimonadetes bacterium]|nr:AAA family ATPase [Armatimonadota bacterium]